MSIVRIKKSREYFAASNVPFNDNRLSWEARGMIGYLLSKPDNWTIRFTDLERQSAAGAHKVRRILKELEETGYLERKKMQNKDGTFFWLSTIYETPAIYQLSIDGSSTYGSSIDGLSIDGKPRDIDITDSLNTDLTSTELKKTERVENTPSDEFQAMVYMVQEITGIAPFTPADAMAVNQLVEMGAIKEDVQAGYNWYKNQGKQFRYYNSIIGPVRTAQTKRLGKPAVAQAPAGYTPYIPEE